MESLPDDVIDGLAPGLVGMGLHARVRPRDILATIVDLAVRGHLRVLVEDDERRRDWVLSRGPAARRDLRPFEHSFLDRVFAGGATVSLRELSCERRGAVRKLANQLMQAAVKDGWFIAARPERRFQWWGLWAGLGAAVAAGLIAPAWQGAVAAVLCGVAGLFTLYQPDLRVRRTARGAAVRATLARRRQHLSALDGAGDEIVPWLVAFDLTGRLPALVDSRSTSQTKLGFDWVTGPGGAGDVAWVVVGLTGQAAAEIGFRALGGAALGLVAGLLDGAG